MVLRRGYILGVGAVSLVTMPLTAGVFLLLGPLAMVVAAVVAATRRSPTGQAAALETGYSIAIGLLVGPAVYLALALFAA